MGRVKDNRDFFRDTWIRYLGYANEVGESLRPVIPKRVVHYSYGVAIGYVLADTIDKGLNKLWRDGASRRVIWATGDALLWQTFASLVIPGIAINRIVHYSDRYVYKLVPKMNPHTRAWVTVGIGLASIPIIVTPIDYFVHFVMSCTYRRIFKS